MKREMRKQNWNKNREILKSISNPTRDAYEIKMKIPELTFEGVRSQPDFAQLYITFYPGDKVIELKSLKVKDVMTKNPIKIEKNILATRALAIMNENKITSLCVYDEKKKSITIGILHIHNILNKKIY